MRGTDRYILSNGFFFKRSPDNSNVELRILEMESPGGVSETPTFGKLKHEDQEFEAHLSIHQDPVSKL